MPKIVVLVCSNCKGEITTDMKECPRCGQIFGKPDMVNSPPHYQTAAGIESINVIEAFELGFHLGNVVKYILRAGKKNNELEDLKKARWYLNRKIEQMEQKE